MYTCTRMRSSENKRKDRRRSKKCGKLFTKQQCNQRVPILNTTTSAQWCNNNYRITRVRSMCENTMCFSQALAVKYRWLLRLQDQ